MICFAIRQKGNFSCKALGGRVWNEQEWWYLAIFSGQRWYKDVDEHNYAIEENM